MVWRRKNLTLPLGFRPWTAQPGLFWIKAYLNKINMQTVLRHFAGTRDNTGRSKSLCAPDDYSTKNTQKYFK
jgi:hypothetical protein